MPLLCGVIFRPNYSWATILYQVTLECVGAGHISYSSSVFLKLGHDLSGGLVDKLLKLRIPIPINSTCERRYTKQSTVPAKQRIQKISKVVNGFVEHRFLNQESCLYCTK